jgi:type III pantothenate kinase
VKPAVVVDVGNTRIKWGRVSGNEVVESVSLPPEDWSAWQAQLNRWQLVDASPWALATVHPQRGIHFGDWLKRLGHSIATIENYRSVPISIGLEKPEQVGIDRLLTALAAKSRSLCMARCIIINAGTAITVDLVDETGTFCGGAIFPGRRLMARALHDHTALLPLVQTDWDHQAEWTILDAPGHSTESAIKAGIQAAVSGGISALVHRMAQSGNSQDRPPEVFITGGDAPILVPFLDTGIYAWPHMTLEGIRLAAEALP